MTPGFEGSVAAVILALGLGVQSPAQAQAQARTPGAEAQDVLVLTVPSGDLSRALESLAAQSGIDLIYESGLVAGRTTPGLSARTTAAEAMRRLLRDTGLVARRASPGVWILERSEATQLEEIVVTGTLLRGRGPVGSPVVSLSLDELDRRGHASVADAVQALPQNYGGTGTPAAFLSSIEAGSTNTTLSTGVNLRGLGPDATLVLIDGRRLSGSGSQGEFSDLSAAPAAAVDRVDVLLDGASALYGSDAVAGVVNVILRDDYEGAESRLRVGAAKGGAEEVQLSHLAGTEWSSGSALFSLEHRVQKGLNASDRPYTATGDLRDYGGSDWRTPFASPGNIVAFNAALGGYESLWALRPGADGVVDDPADFAAGEANLDHRRRDVDIIPDQTRSALFGRLRQELTSRVDLRADLRLSRRDFNFLTYHHAPIMTVTAANPQFVSPNGSSAHAIAYSFIGDMAQPRVTGSVDHRAGSLGLDVQLPGDWDAEIYVAHGRERSEGDTPLVNTTFLDEALGNRPDDPATAWSPGRNAYFNPFGSGGLNDPDTIAFVTSGFSRNWLESGLTTASAVAQGELLQGPGGPIRLAVGTQWREETFEGETRSLASGTTPLTTNLAERRREIAAAFAELRAPLVGPDNGRPGLRRLDLSLAGRAERYSDFGSTANPKVGVTWTPMDGLDVRTSWGTSFRAPSLNELNEPVRIGPTTTREAGVTRLAVITLGGNPELEAETAESLTLGFDWRPDTGPRLSATLFDIAFENRIARPVGENILNALTDPALARFVQRVDPANNPEDLALVESLITDPRFLLPGAFPASAFAAVLDGRWLNTGELRVRGLDISASHHWRTPWGDIDAEAMGTRLFDYERRVTPDAAAVDRVGVLGQPVELRARASLGWTQGAWDARLGISHVAGYDDFQGESIEAWTTGDVSLGWTGQGRWDGVTAQVFVANVTDADPPFVDLSTGYGFDAGQASPLGRTVSLHLVKRW
ncbi:TonB-dependent receptor [Brevundimonas lutea]|uniref:TonB-dependent receptor n=1 Tax=Brevundimonas lutea TaxID=2293980 RepID=UPI000F023E90|nr:TonB-dependent receptor [Brevundimonas lutea]